MTAPLPETRPTETLTALTQHGNMSGPNQESPTLLISSTAVLRASSLLSDLTLLKLSYKQAVIPELY